MQLINSLIVGIIVSSNFGAYADIRLRDNFEYNVSREQTGKSAAFAAGGGWSGAKSNPENPGACGYIYTSASIPGFSGTFPGSNSSRVLSMEFLPQGLNCLVGENWWQTDAYLAIGGQGAPQNTIPPNMWVQFWIYINNFGPQQTRWGSTKWLYPCIDGIYPCTGSNVSFLHILRPGLLNPWPQELPPGGADVYPFVRGAGAYFSPGDPEPGPDKLSPNISPDTGKLIANRWTLVRIHTDISGSQGVYQEWHKSVEGNFVQVSNWVGGVTQNFSWPLAGLNSARTQGQKSLKLGTTWQNSDGWIYLDDFVMASSVADLPNYNGAPPPVVLSAPRNLRVVPN